MATAKTLTFRQVSRLIANGSKRLTPQEMGERLAALGFRIKKSLTFHYTRRTGERVKALRIYDTATGLGFSHHELVENPEYHERLAELQAIRNENTFVFHRGMLWQY